MEVAKMTSKGQLTVPKAIREKLNLESGSKVVFIQMGDDLVVRNAESMVKSAKHGSPDTEVGFYRLTPDAYSAFRSMQEVFADLAEDEGVHTGEELVKWMRSAPVDDSE